MATTEHAYHSEFSGYDWLNAEHLTGVSYEYFLFLIVSLYPFTFFIFTGIIWILFFLRKFLILRRKYWFMKKIEKSSIMSYRIWETITNVGETNILNILLLFSNRFIFSVDHYYGVWIQWWRCDWVWFSYYYWVTFALL